MRLKQRNSVLLHGLLKQQWINLFPHTVNHAHLRWGLGRGRHAGAGFPADSAILLGPPAVRERDEGASSGDEEPSNQTTQVVHLVSGSPMHPHGQMHSGVEQSGEHYGDMFMAAVSSRGHNQEWWHR
ncbi:hypothetical protein F7725_018574 [Dissostichus mawsoni]|uniref:Uncharacterized protein n=1 Tax=Dissostichus mawsoni TaxID=36200 RepID=A0A7J5XTE8_DISMA|nr:hypothetical protein F7725_018574 [Dissostichus mawsoni]